MKPAWRWAVLLALPAMHLALHVLGIPHPEWMAMLP